MRRGDWMQTATGKHFWPLDPRPEDVDIVDIALGLGKICRYGGHCLRFYSVAEHSWLVAHACPPEHRMWGLLHDATEAYLGDVIRPLKRFIPGYHEIEDTLARVIAEHFNLPWPMPEAVKEIDNRILLDEFRQNMKRPDEVGGDPAEVGAEELGVEIQCWRPDYAAERFLDLYRELGGTL